MKTTAKCILYFTIVIFVLSLSSVLLAQGLADLKGVQLNDGTVIPGKVIESNINQVVIEKKDGSRVSVKFNDVSKFLKDEQIEETTKQEKSKPSAVDSKRNYVALKAGIYEPNHDDLHPFDTGFNGEVALGHYLNRNFALELGVGYFRVKGSESDDAGKITVYPVTLSLKAIYPINKVEIYALGGLGMYFARLDYKDRTRDIGYQDDNNITFGGQLGAGLNFNITNEVFLGIEGKYFWTDHAKWDIPKYNIDDAESHLDGLIVTGNLGIRF